jgi:23S rRNA (uracil1939-C5)-methyltransferase
MQEATLKLEKFTYGGDVMGRLEDPLTGAGGRAVFVPFGLPGERVRVRLVEEKKRFARGEIIEMLEESPQRIKPKCAHFGACGGCHYQHIPYEDQVQAKTEILRDQLRRIGKIEAPPLRPMVASSNPWNYRNHVGFHLTDGGKLGYVFSPHHGGGGRVEAIRECHLPEKAINELWPQLAFEPELPVERVSLRGGINDDLMLILESGGIDAPEMELEAGISVVHLTEDDALVMAGNDHIWMQIKERVFRVSAGSFFQVNTPMAGKMVDYLLERLPISPSASILEVYCGVGTFSAFLAERCGQLTGIEISAPACEDFLTNLDEFDHVALYEDDAGAVMPQLEEKQDIILVDPPRAGLDRHVLDGIVGLNPGVIAYVSCDPATLARDAARLIKGGYDLVDVTPFDLFPQTYHIESISLFELKE